MSNWTFPFFFYFNFVFKGERGKKKREKERYQLIERNIEHLNVINSPLFFSHHLTLANSFRQILTSNLSGLRSLDLHPFSHTRTYFLYPPNSSTPLLFYSCNIYTSIGSDTSSKTHYDKYLDPSQYCKLVNCFKRPVVMSYGVSPDLADIVPPRPIHISCSFSRSPLTTHHSHSPLSTCQLSVSSVHRRLQTGNFHKLRMSDDITILGSRIG